MRRMGTHLLALVLCFFVLLGVIPQKADAASIVAKGDISLSQRQGDNVDYVLYSDGKLVISGSGKMVDWESNDGNPFEPHGADIKKVVIESGVTNIGLRAFYGCVNLTSVTIPDTVKEIGDYAFAFCDKLETVKLVYGIEEIGFSAFWYCTSLKEIKIPSSVAIIENHAFGHCQSLPSIKIPNSVTRLGSDAFYDCTSLKTATIPSSVGSLAVSVFQNCTSLESVSLGSGIKAIYGNAFSGCTNLKSITLPDAVYNIYDDAFKNCSSLETITIPSEVYWIGRNVFDGCTGLSSIYFLGPAPTFGYDGIQDTFKNVKATAYYREGDLTWTSSVKKNYGGNITWKGISDMNGMPDATSVKISNDESTGKIKLTWDKVKNADKYEVFRKDSNSNTYQKIKTTTASSYIDKDTDPNEWYFYKVYVVGENGIKSAGSNIVNEICDLPRPEVTVTNIADTGKVQLNWKEVEGAVKYRVYRATSKNGTYSVLGNTANTSYTNNGGEAGKTYYYKVKAIHADSAANSAYSAAVSRTCDLARPNVTVTNVASSGKVKLTWEKVSGAIKYEVYRATSKNGTYSKLGSTSNTSYTNNGGEAGKTYYYKVKAIHSNSAANSAYSAAVSRTCDLTRPDVTVKLSSGNVKVSWAKISGATEYKVYRATSKDGTYKLVKTTTSASYTDKNVNSGKTYYYKVKAIHKTSSANSAYSSIDAIKIK